MTASKRVSIAPQSDPVTAVLQAEIDRGEAGLHLRLEPGIHRCGGLRLRSHMILELAEGAELHFLSDYEAYAQTPVSVVAEESDRGMLVAQRAEHLSIIGKGRIFGNGAGAFTHGEDAGMGTLVAHKLRPRVIVLEECRNLTIQGISIDDAPLWTMHFVACDGVKIEDVHVDNNRRMPNTDGIVIDGCRNVLIERCEFRTADDGIVLKTTRRPDGSLTGACDTITARDCVIESHSCALKLGTESFSPFRNIVFEDIRIEKSNRGLGIFSRDGGLVENIRFARITLDCHETPAGFWGSGEAVTINTVDRRPEEGPAGTVRHVVVEDISGLMEGAINLVAERPGDISEVTLRRIALRQQPGRFGTGLTYDIRPTEADRFDRFEEEGAKGRVNAWRFDAEGRIIGLIDYPGGMPALFAKGVAGLVMEEVTVDRPDPLPERWNPQNIVIS
ncbi:polygalacturonase PglB [Rhizobium paknamense]|uniref:Polygalacturonase n=1 Tax=Rhizobium paknamense TaxID=1206817 RepID=A0ABU0IE33_9HYPH|nr:glycoside hydrolase family 28 protein [Rhizobium paknamense]MDQ0455705.1 polygalacturonase [Rhizobium paknamense]